MIAVEIVYGSVERQTILALEVKPGTSVKSAIEISGLLEQMPEINLQKQPVGIFGKRVTLDQVLESGDRVEIYRPLRISPREARRLRANSK